MPPRQLEREGKSNLDYPGCETTLINGFTNPDYLGMSTFQPAGGAFNLNL